MRYHIRHQTNYFYNQPVILSPHLLRLRPKSDGGQTLREFTLKINPEPLTITNIIDLDGNSCLQIWSGGTLVLLASPLVMSFWPS